MSDQADRMLEIFRQAVQSELRREEADLTLRQLGIFLVVSQDTGGQTVRGLAKALLIGTPVVTRSVDRLSSADLVKRARDPADARSVLVMRTELGDAMMRRLSDAMGAAAADMG